MNASRPRSWRVSPSFASSRSTTFCVAMPGVVVAGLPEHRKPAHPVPADEQILDRRVQRVSHVQAAGHVRRRNRDHERLALGIRLGLRRGPPLPRSAASVLRRPRASRADPSARSLERSRGAGLRPGAGAPPGYRGQRETVRITTHLFRLAPGLCSSHGRRDAPGRPRYAPRSSKPCGRDGRPSRCTAPCPCPP